MKKLLRCTLCQKFKDTEEFYKDRSVKRQRSYRCKLCDAAMSRKQYVKTWVRDRTKLTARSANNRKIFNQTKRKWFAEYQAKSTRKNRQKYPHRFKARWLYYHAFKAGKLKKLPCRFCGSSKVQAHHCDYRKPLDVMWLCNTHHGAWHRLFIAAE